MERDEEFWMRAWCAAVADGAAGNTATSFADTGLEAFRKRFKEEVPEMSPVRIPRRVQLDREGD